MITNSPILITGCPRSGTSMIAGMLSLSGVFSGVTDKMYENIPIREGLVKNYLRQVGMGDNGHYPLISKYPLVFPEYWNEKVMTEITKQGLSNTQWMYKDCRNSLLWQLWYLSFPNAKWIIVRRNREDIIYSCQHTGYMRTFDDYEICQKIGAENPAQAWAWMIDEYEMRFKKILKCKNVREVWPEKIANGDFSEIKEVWQWLGIEWDEEKMKTYIQPKFYKHNNKEEIK